MSSERLIIDDLIVLGNAVPDEISDNRKTVCTAGYSPKYGLIRVYPVPPNASMKRWHVVEVPLERNPHDTRDESWKIQGSKAEWDKLKFKVIDHEQLNRQQRIDLLNELHRKFGVGCVQDLNDQKLSLGFIKPTEFEYRLEKRKQQEKGIQTTLFSKEPFLTVHNYDVQPRMRYRCSGCKSKNPHDQQILEWGVYEWIRKNPNNMEQVWDNLHIGESGYDTSFLVGNMFLHRSSFMIISIFRHKISA
ncbi:MAG: hypothetical protein LDL06_02900 [Candidatus Nitrosotenuis sp.]|nr:hypothetical protein [Candidatus Nitrosotenuis sp.]